MTNKAVSSGEMVSRFGRILLPLDGSKHGETALSYAEGLAAATKAETFLLQAGKYTEVPEREILQSQLM